MPGKSGEDNPNKDKECFNCHKKSHLKPDCWVKGRGKEGRGLEGEIKHSIAPEKSPNMIGFSILGPPLTVHICTVRDAFTEF